MIRRLLAPLLAASLALAPALVRAGSYPSPTYGSVTLQTGVVLPDGTTITCGGTASGCVALGPALGAEAATARAAEAANATAITNGATALAAEAARAKIAEAANAAGITTNGSAIATEITRAQAAEAVNASGVSGNASAIASEAVTARAAEAANATAISSEATRAKAAETTNASGVSANTAAISTETTRAQAAENLLAPLANPALTGTPTAPTAAPGTSSTALATTAFSTGGVAAEAARAQAAEGKALQATNNLSDVPTPATARSNLGLAAVAASGSASDLAAGTLSAARLPASGASAGSAVLPSVTVDAYGRITALSQGALTGDVITTPGSLASTIAANAVTNAKLATMAAGTLKANTSASSATPSDVTPSALLDATFGSTQGSVLYRDSAAWKVLAPGSSGQVLGSGGASANPGWVTPAGGTTGTQTANTFLGGPASGSAASPGYRALVNADLPASTPGTLRGNATGAAATATDLAPSAALGVLGLNTTAQNSFRNRLRDGAFTINQRAVSGTVALAAVAYGHDGWKGGASGATYTFAASGIDTVASISAGTLVQVVEAAKVEGGAYTASWAGTAQCRATYTASGASSTTTTAYAASPLAVPATGAGTSITEECGAGSGSGTVTLTRAQLEPGTVATAFERREPAVDMLICQRYFQIMTYNVRLYANDGNVFPVTFTYPSMRVAPTATISGSSSNSNSSYPTFTPYVAGGVLNMAASAAGAVSSTGTITLSAEL